MKAGIGTTSLGSLAAMAAALTLLQTAGAPAAAAQDSGSVSDYRLPAPTQTSRPTVQGPVDPENPFGVPGRTPAPERNTVPAPAPTITPPPPTAQPSPLATAAPRPRPTAAARGTPTASATVAAPAATAAAATDAALDEPTPVPAAPATEVAAPRELPAEESSNWLIPGLAGAAVIGAGAFLFLRRRRTGASVAEEEVAPAAAPPPAPRAPAPRARASQDPQQASPPAREPVPPLGAASVPPAAAPLPAEPLALATAFTARAVRLSLVYATLQYELEITNAGPEPLPPLQVRADLASAHGSIGTREQLAPAPGAMEAQQTVAALVPGEAATLRGEVRVPLQQIVPVRKGNAHFLVPLARFCILAPDGTAVRRVFTAGPHDPGSNAIASVRLDAGPRNLRDLHAREIEAARSFTLDPVGAQG